MELFYLSLLNGTHPDTGARMKTTIYYFTGTGNSLHAARLLAEHMGNCDTVSIPYCLASGKPITGENIVLVFPVYMYRVPHIVCTAAGKIRNAGSISAVATMGGEAGVAFRQLRSILRKNSQDLNAGFTVTMPDNYIPFNGAMEEEEQRKMLIEASEKIKDIAARIVKKEKTFEDTTSFFSSRIWPGLWYWYAYVIIPKLARYFRAEASCNGCGTCSKVCPKNNIEMQNGKPCWSDRCEMCLACLHWCPEKAIQYSNKTKDKKRYRNLFITQQDIIAQKP